MIDIDNVCMSYQTEDDEVTVLSDLSMQVKAGETVAVVGPSGSGKSTLLQLLSGLEQPSGGEVSLAGQDLAKLSYDELADWRRDQLGIVFQSFHLLPSLTAAGNVALPLEIAGKKQARAEAVKMLANVGLAHRQNHYPRQLSGGEQQRVAIARALVHSPQILLADEPTGNLDDKTGKTISDLLFSLNADLGATMVMVTHDTQIANRCQRVLRLHDGKLIEER